MKPWEIAKQELEKQQQNPQGLKPWEVAKQAKEAEANPQGYEYQVRLPDMRAPSTPGQRERPTTKGGLVKVSAPNRDAALAKVSQERGIPVSSLSAHQVREHRTADIDPGVKARVLAEKGYFPDSAAARGAVEFAPYTANALMETPTQDVAQGFFPAGGLGVRDMLSLPGRALAAAPLQKIVQGALGMNNAPPIRDLTFDDFPMGKISEEYAAQGNIPGFLGATVSDPHLLPTLAASLVPGGGAASVLRAAVPGIQFSRAGIAAGKLAANPIARSAMAGGITGLRTSAVDGALDLLTEDTEGRHASHLSRGMLAGSAAHMSTTLGQNLLSRLPYIGGALGRVDISPLMANAAALDQGREGAGVPRPFIDPEMLPPTASPFGAVFGLEAPNFPNIQNRPQNSGFGGAPGMAGLPPLL